MSATANNRKKLLRFLHSGGHIVRDEYTNGSVYWRPASRSGPAVYDDKAVRNLQKRGHTQEDVKWALAQDSDGTHFLTYAGVK